MPRFHFVFLIAGFSQVQDRWMGHASNPLIMDDFGNGVEMGLRQWAQAGVSLADCDI